VKPKSPLPNLPFFEIQYLPTQVGDYYVEVFLHGKSALGNARHIKVNDTPLLTDHDDGTYTIRVTPFAEGALSLTVRVAENEVPGSPLDGEVLSGNPPASQPSDPAQCVVELGPLIVGQSSFLKIFSKNKNGEPQPIGGETFVVKFCQADDQNYP